MTASPSLHMVRLLNLMQAFRTDEKKSLITHEEEQILAYVYERENRGQTSTISDIVVSRLSGTPPTVQRRVNQLTAKGCLIFAKDKNDLRKQNLMLSDCAIKYMEDFFKYLDPELKG